jgi:hypothetical protein
MRRFFQIRSIPALGTLLVLAFCLGAGASVFKVLGPKWSGWVPVGQLPWDKAYETEMRVNGKRVELQVFTAGYDQPVEAQLKQVLESIGSQVRSSSSGGAGVATLNSYEVSYLVSAPPSEPVKFIFLSYRDPRETAASGFPVAFYPNGEVISTVSDSRTKAEYLSIETTDTSTEVHEFYQHLLMSEGWEQIRPCEISAGESKGLAIYGKKGKICFIDVVPNKNFYSTVSILVEKAH